MKALVLNVMRWLNKNFLQAIVEAIAEKIVTAILNAICKTR